jgi:hypothetical protein
LFGRALLYEARRKDDRTNGNNGTNEKIIEDFRLFRYFRLFRHLNPD